MQQTPDQISPQAAKHLAERLRELEMQATGLPPSVYADLGGTVQDLLDQGQVELTKNIEALKCKQEAALKAAVAKAIDVGTIIQAYKKLQRDGRLRATSKQLLPSFSDESTKAGGAK